MVRHLTRLQFLESCGISKHSDLETNSKISYYSNKTNFVIFYTPYNSSTYRSCNLIQTWCKLISK